MKLFTEYTFGSSPSSSNLSESKNSQIRKFDEPIKVSQRVVLAPLTRMRSSKVENIPMKMAIEYYKQRSSYEGSLLISEGTIISKEAQGHPCVPGIYNSAQVEGWKPVIDAVHQNKCLFFCQFWHVGRASHCSFQPNGNLPVSSSPKKVDSLIGYPLDDGSTNVPYSEVHALSVNEIKRVLDDYKNAARCAMEAGFDGIEIHGANGYLVHQFLEDGVNERQDQYGGSIENRCRFLFEIIEALSEVYPLHRIGVRFSPLNGFLEMKDSNPVALYTYLLGELNKKNLAYVHLVEPRVKGNIDDNIQGDDNYKILFGDNYKNEEFLSIAKYFRNIYKGSIIAAGGYDRNNGIKVVEEGYADAVAYGRYFISNPDLPKRLEMNLELNKYNRSTFYTQGEEGYIDYSAYGK